MDNIRIMIVDDHTFSRSNSRRSVWDLLPRALEEQTLEGAIAEEVRAITSEGTIRADLRVSGTHRDISSQAQTALLRVCQESLTNIRKHSKATEVELRLEFDSEYVRLSISDNGVGIQCQIPDARYGTFCPGH